MPPWFLSYQLVVEIIRVVVAYAYSSLSEHFPQLEHLSWQLAFEPHIRCGMSKQIHCACFFVAYSLFIYDLAKLLQVHVDTLISDLQGYALPLFCSAYLLLSNINSAVHLTIWYSTWIFFVF